MLLNIAYTCNLLLCSQHLALDEHQTYVDSRKPSASAAIFIQTGSDLLMQSSLNANYDDKKTETQEQH